MEYNPAGNNLDLVVRTSGKVKEILRRKAQAGADYWRSNSVIVTGYNASHVQVVESFGSEGQMQSAIYASGNYAKWRVIGSSRAGPRAPEWTLRRALPTIQEA